jgi:adenylate cyclase
MTTRGVERTFAFVDIAGFTALTEAHGDEEAVATLTRFREMTNEALGSGDLLVKTIGDAVMLAFSDPALAVVALRRLFDNALRDSNMPLIRAGAHDGSAIPEGNDFFGAVVNVAARVAAQAAGGQLLVTERVAVAATSLGEVVTHVGAVSLRNIAEPVDLYEIELNPHASTAIDPVCAMKVPTTGPSAVHLNHNDRDVWFCGLPCVSRYAAAPEAFGPVANTDTRL